MTVRPAQDGVMFIKNVMVPMSDGTHLAMDLHVPECENWEQTPQPPLLEYIPYRKDDAAPYTPYQNDFAKAGFIGARLDAGGREAAKGPTTTSIPSRYSLTPCKRSNESHSSHGRRARSG